MSRPEFNAKDEPLREDVRRLGGVVGDMLRAQEGAEFFEMVESTRLSSQAARQGDDNAGEILHAKLAGLALATREKLVAAFSAYFGAINMAEQIHRIRRRRDYDRHGVQPNSPRAAFAALKAEGHSASDVRAALARLAIEPVFTAHPTESIRRALLSKQQRIARALVDRMEPGALTPPEEQRAWDRIIEEVHASWQTEEHFSQQPTLADEAEHVLFYLSEVIYRIVPSFYESVETAFEQVFESRFECPAFVRFASWVGGDMDGNPNAGAATMEQSLRQHRDAILRLYLQEARRLSERLSQGRGRARFSPALRARQAELAAEFAHEANRMPHRDGDMPYRALLYCIILKLEATLREDQRRYLTADDLLADIDLISDSLRDHAGILAGWHHVRRWQRRVQTFGFHFATLDTRQDSEVHRRACGDCLDEEGFSSFSGTQRAAALEAALSQGRVARPSGGAAGVVEVFSTLSRLQRIHGPGALGPYIVSMAQGADDLLAVLFLARQGGLVDGGHVPLDVAPLFETVDDLDHAAETLGAALSNPHYRAHLAARESRQYVMLGYSDSAKDAGIASARWALYRAQEKLVARAREARIRLVLFHGRGGTVSRGGTKVTQAIPATPPGSVDYCLRVTEQGEIIHARYGLRGIAQRTLEVMTTAVLRQSMVEAGLAPPRSEWCAVMDTIANASRAAYRALVHDDPRLLAYFLSATPVDVITRMRLGSRPASRRSQNGIGDLRAIPWVFAWTQSRLNLPGWYGVGQGLQDAVSRHGLAAVCDAAQHWPVLRVLLADVEMVMAKADIGIAARYADLAEPEARGLFDELRQQFESTRESVLQVSGQQVLLQKEPWLARAIGLRNPYIDPMSLSQVELLRHWRQGDRQDGALEQALFTTVKGIARGLLNTG